MLWKSKKECKITQEHGYDWNWRLAELKFCCWAWWLHVSLTVETTSNTLAPSCLMQLMCQSPMHIMLLPLLAWLALFANHSCLQYRFFLEISCCQFACHYHPSLPGLLFAAGWWLFIDFFLTVLHHINVDAVFTVTPCFFSLQINSITLLCRIGNANVPPLVPLGWLLLIY